MKISRLSCEIVHFIPENIENGVLYVSERYRTAAHNCCCGCGEKVVTPLKPTYWAFKLEKRAPTLYPSIGNWSYACRSHYWVRQGKVVWASDIPQELIESGRQHDCATKQAYFDAQDRKAAAARPDQNEAGGVFKSLWRLLTRWWKP